MVTDISMRALTDIVVSEALEVAVLNVGLDIHNRAYAAKTINIKRGMVVFI